MGLSSMGSYHPWSAHPHVGMDKFISPGNALCKGGSFLHRASAQHGTQKTDGYMCPCAHEVLFGGWRGGLEEAMWCEQGRIQAQSTTHAKVKGGESGWELSRSWGVAGSGQGLCVQSQPLLPRTPGGEHSGLPPRGR